MKRVTLMLAALFCMQFLMAQMNTAFSDSEIRISGPVDDSFILSPDTLWFITGDDFVYGKQFYIVNPHNYPLDIQHITQWGIPCLECIPWHTTPMYPVFPVMLPANDSIPILVQFLVIDLPSVDFLYDSCVVSTIGSSGQSVAGKTIVAPNPFIDKVNISLGVTRETAVDAMIFNTLMQPVKELYTGTATPSKNYISWDGTDQHGSEVSKGLYFIRIRMGSEQKTIKVIKTEKE
ncbi:MAG: T9SS type A sorting domain-containing protein [Bacteroidetes bacterium]|nr:T9SS type A sorting domain-containing protein [Bacteroidota bacterium]